MRDGRCNLRKALAGLLVLKGYPLGRALKVAGYSESTAKAPGRNGLQAGALLAELRKIDPASLEAAVETWREYRVEVRR